MKQFLRKKTRTLSIKYVKVFITIAVLVSSTLAISQTAMKVHNYYFYYKKEIAKPTITISTMTPVNKKKNIYFSTYTIVRYSWAQCVLGFDAAVTDWMILGFKSGIQTESNGIMGRYSPILYIRKNKLNIFGVYEWGGYKDRSQGMICYRIKDFNPGIMEAHNGKLVAIGPMLEYFIPKTSFAIYGSALNSLSDGKFCSQFGVYIRFMPDAEEKKIMETETSMFYNMPDFRPVP